MNWATFAGSAKSELSQSNVGPPGIHTPTFTHSEQSSIAEKLSYTGTKKRKGKKKKHNFHLVPLETCGAFPVSMVTVIEFWSQREAEMNTRLLQKFYDRGLSHQW